MSREQAYAREPLPSPWALLRSVYGRIARKAIGGEFTLLRPTTGSGKWGVTESSGDPYKIAEAFKGICFACIDVIAKEFAAQATFIAQKKVSSKEFKDVPLDHPLSLLLDKPNPYFTPFDLWYLVASWRHLFGNAYLWIARDRSGTPRYLWPLEPKMIKPIPGDLKKGEPIIKAYELKWSSGESTTLPSEDVVHLKRIDPTAPYYSGMSTVMKAAMECDTMNYITSYHKEWFENNAMPSYMAVFPDGLDPDVLKAFQEQFQDRYGKKPGQIYWSVGQNFKLESLQNNNSNLDFTPVFTQHRKVFQSVFHVPDSKLGFVETVEARATSETQDYQFQKDVIHSIKVEIAQQLTLDLAASEFEDDLVVSVVSTIPADKRLDAELDKQYLEMSVLSINEVRVKRGLLPIPGGDEPTMSFNRVPLSQVTAPAVLPPANEPKRLKEIPGIRIRIIEDGKRLRLLPIGKEAITEEMKVNAWKVHSRIQARHEMALAKKIAKVLNAIRDDALKTVNESKSGKDDRTVSERFHFNVEQWVSTLSEPMQLEVRKILNAAFDDFVASYGIEGAVFAPNDPRVFSAIRRVNAKTVTVPETLHSELTATLDEGIRLNESPELLAKRVTKYFEETTEWKALRIARTVSNYAVNEGNRIAAIDAGGFTTKTWVSQRDALVRDLHADVDGMDVKINQKFELANGDLLDVPGDPSGKAESVIGCRCTALFTKGND